MRLNRIRMTKESVRVSCYQAAPGLRARGSHQCCFVCLISTLSERRLRPSTELCAQTRGTVSVFVSSCRDLPASWGLCLWMGHVVTLFPLPGPFSFSFVL